MDVQLMIPARSAQHGFTLIELMIVVALLAIISAFALPAFQSFIASNRLTSEANELLSGLNLARSEAVRTQCSARLCRATFASDGTASCVNTNDRQPWEGWVVLVGITTSTGACDSEMRLRAQMAPSNLNILSSADLAASGNSIVFRPDGLARPLSAPTALQNAQIDICDSSGTLTSNNVRRVTLRSGTRTAVERASDTTCGTAAAAEEAEATEEGA